MAKKRKCLLSQTGDSVPGSSSPLEVTGQALNEAENARSAVGLGAASGSATHKLAACGQGFFNILQLHLCI